MKTKIIPLIFAFFLIVSLTACTGEELREQAFISEMGADPEDSSDNTQPVRMTLRTFQSDDVVSGSGASLLSALSNCESTQGRIFFPGHLEVFAAGPKNLKNDLMTLLRNNRISPSCRVVLAKDGASRLIEENKGKLRELIDSSGRNALIVPKNISDVVNDLLEKDKTAAVPTISTGKPAMAVVSEDGTMGMLTDKESEGLCWLTGSIKDVYIPISTDNINTDFHVVNCSTRLTAQSVGSDYAVTVEIKINGTAEDDNADIDAVKKQTSKLITSLCSLTIAKTVTAMNADLFGIEKSLNAKRLALNEEWEETIPKLKFFYKIRIAE